MEQQKGPAHGSQGSGLYQCDPYPPAPKRPGDLRGRDRASSRRRDPARRLGGRRAAPETQPRPRRSPTRPPYLGDGAALARRRRGAQRGAALGGRTSAPESHRLGATARHSGAPSLPVSLPFHPGHSHSADFVKVLHRR